MFENELEELEHDFLTKLAPEKPLTIQPAEAWSNSEQESEADLERKRKRRIYQQRYRAGLIPPAKAKEHKRAKTKDDGERVLESRKKLTYYLSPETKELLYETLKQLSVQRREFIVNSLNSYLAVHEKAEEVTKTDADFKERKFVFDEVPSELWDRLDAFCRDDKKKKVVRLYQVVEAALLEALKDHERRNSEVD